MTQVQRATTADGHRAIFHAAVTYIAANLAASLTLRDVAAASYTSRRQLQRVFADMGHMTVGAYITEVRMRHARALIVGSELPLDEVAAEVGYRHLSAFIKAFRLHYGTTPGELRRRPAGQGG